MTPWKAGMAWVVVLVVATTLTWQIVSFADSQVSAQPVEIETQLDPADTTTTSLSSQESSTSSTSTSTSTASPTTSSSSPVAPTTSTPAAASTSTSTDTTTSTTAEEWSVRTITSDGGTVVVRYRPGEVGLQAATPTPGFAMEIDDSGPPRVRVEFESDDTDIRIEVEWRDGGLDVEIDD